MLSKIANYIRSIRFFPGPERKWLATVSAIVSVLALLAATYFLHSMILYIMITDEPLYRYALVTSIVPRNIPPFAEFAVLHPVMMCFFAMFVSVNVAIISFGVQRGRSWGRTSAAYSLYLSALIMLGLLIFPNFIIPGKMPGEEYAEFNLFVSKASYIFRIIAAALTLGFLYSARFFEKLSVFPKNNFYLPKEEKNPENEKTEKKDEILKNEKN